VEHSLAGDSRHSRLPGDPGGRLFVLIPIEDNRHLLKVLIASLLIFNVASYIIKSKSNMEGL
jgi:hypothetical protein